MSHHMSAARLRAGASPLVIERKDEGAALAELKTIIEGLGQDFESFKQANDQRVAAIDRKKADVLLEDKVVKIGESLDKLVEAKAALEAKLDAERKEREALELRLSAPGGSPGDRDAAEAEMKAFNLALKAEALEKARSYTALDRASYDAYKAAFGAFVRTDKASLSAEQIKALQVGVDPDGGYLVSADVSGRIVTRVYETSPIRPIANVQAISTDALEGIEDLGEAGSGWVGETEARTETSTPQVGKWRIPVFEVYAEPRATQKMLDDAAVDVEGWLAMKVADRFARRENLAFVAGTGVNSPRGFTDYATALDDGSGVTWGSVGHVVSGASGAFAASNPADRLHDLVGALKNEYLPNARFVTRRSVVTLIRKFKDGQGQYLWQPGIAAGQSETLLGYPVVRAEDMPALGSASKSLYFGDFRQAYQIVDRAGIRTLRDPYTTKGYVKFYSTRRVGGGLVNFEAIKAMVFSA